MEDTNIYRARKRQRRRHLERLTWLEEKAFVVGYVVAVLATTGILYVSYPWWAVLIAMPLVLVASLSFGAVACVPFLIPVWLYQWVVDRIYAEEKSGDWEPDPRESDV